jgi:DNA polymerase III alpha subunit
MQSISPIVEQAQGWVAEDRWRDPAVWEMIANGGSRAVHHIESPAMVSLCRMSNVRDIDGLVAIVSVIRPGAANEQNKLRFTRRYQGLEPVTYPHPSLEKCLSDSWGLVIYEEHILKICEQFAGLTGGRGDVLRRALNKGNQEVIETIRKEFFTSAYALAREDRVIQEVWELVAGFAGYAFCKAHSAAYGLEAYQSAWLKCYFPTEFMAAVLTNGKGFYDPLVYVLECHRLGISLLAPWINQPGPGFVPLDKQIRVPISYIKGISAKTVDRILSAFEQGAFESMLDFYRRVQPTAEDLELLIRAGAFDGFGKTRAEQFWEAQFHQRTFSRPDAAGQSWLLPDEQTHRMPEGPLAEPTRHEKLQLEVELFGFPASGHPLELHDNVAWETYCPVSRLGEFIGEQVVMCGLVIEQRVHHQVTGEPMKFLTLADRTGIVETELFASTYRSYGTATVRYPVLEIAGTVEPFENGRGFTLRVQWAGKPRLRAGTDAGSATKE